MSQVVASLFALSGLFLLDVEERQYQLEVAKTVISLLGFGGTIITVALAASQYRRANEWKRAEFVAAEMKAFFSDPQVRNALLLID